jgi:nickel-type superoxide dismutase maturation protease
VAVEGESMWPALQPGDRLLVVRTRRLRPGQLAVADDPRCPDRPLVKRVAAIAEGLVVLLGDNDAASTDSRELGPLALERLRGRAIYRYAPSDRVGSL